MKLSRFTLLILSFCWTVLLTAGCGAAAEPLSPRDDPQLTPGGADECARAGQRWVNPADGGEMVCVPAGEFWMGAAEGDPGAEPGEKPGRQVYLDAYWIDRFEVTNAQYQRCVSAGGCTPPREERSFSRGSYYRQAAFADFPVVYVDWNQASAYCAWAGEGLPTEAQWEKAARGTDGRLYPWGDQAPTSSLANFLAADTVRVGSYPEGASPYGAEDMAGNVWEWAADWYSGDYYESAPSRNPPGPQGGGYRVLRGGSWYNEPAYLRVSGRLRTFPDLLGSASGFRCAYRP